MRARARDVVAAVVLIAGLVTAVSVWHPLGRWVAFGVALGTVLLAAGVYRLRPSAFPWRDAAGSPERQHADR